LRARVRFEGVSLLEGVWSQGRQLSLEAENGKELTSPQACRGSPVC
jgi:hypothetical protein